MEHKKLIYFYEFYYEVFFKLNDSIEKKNKLFVFKKLPYLPWELSKVVSWTFYFAIAVLNIPFGFLERIFFFKTEYFKNNSNGSSLLFRSIWSSLCLLSIYFLLKDDPCKVKAKDFGLAAGILFGLYWNARSVFTRKWDYAASMFNKLCFELPLKRYPSSEVKRIAIHFYQVTFAIDLLTLEIWSHKSYVYSFTEAIEMAIAYKIFCQHYSSTGHINVDVISSEVRNEIQNLYSGRSHKMEDISKILSGFQFDLSDYVINENVFEK